MSDNPDRGNWSTKQLPDSWLWVGFADFWRDFTSSQKRLPQQSYQPHGKFLVVDQGQELIGGHSDAESLLSDAVPPAIVFGDHTRVCKFIEMPFIQGADGVRVLKPAAMIDAKYAYYVLKTIQLPDKGYSRHFKFLKASQFPLAPEQEQPRIVAKLDGLRARSTRARHELDRIPKLIEHYKQAILAKAFSGELTADWRENQERSWHPESKALDQLVLVDAPIVYGVIQPGELLEQGVPLIRVCDIEGDHINWHEVRTISQEINSQYQRSLVIDGDILISIVGTIGRIGIVRNAPPVVNIARAIARLRISPDAATAQWVYYCLMCDAIQWQLVREAREVARKTLNLEQLRAIEIPVPDLDEQLEAVRRINVAFAWLDKIATEYARAERLLPKLDHAILAKAFRGELVAQDPNDEPAAEMLARIRSASDDSTPSTRRGRRQAVNAG